MTDKLSRRRLFGLPEPTPSVRSKGFSLDAFYSQRDAAVQRGGLGHSEELPHFELRTGLPEVETTRVGTPELATHAISKDLAPVPAARLAGKVRIQPEHCLAWQRSFCSVCAERCPEPGAIVSLAGKPQVVARACTGCGLCVQVCPAPVNAFEVINCPPGVPGEELA